MRMLSWDFSGSLICYLLYPLHRLPGCWNRWGSWSGLEARPTARSSARLSSLCRTHISHKWLEGARWAGSWDWLEEWSSAFSCSLWPVGQLPARVHRESGHAKTSPQEYCKALRATALSNSKHTCGSHITKQYFYSSHTELALSELTERRSSRFKKELFSCDSWMSKMEDVQYLRHLRAGLFVPLLHHPLGLEQDLLGLQGPYQSAGLELDVVPVLGDQLDGVSRWVQVVLGAQRH